MTTVKSKHYIPHIDGLRAIAVLAVLLFHLDVPFLGGGFIGVDIFFVISGYLITNIIQREIGAGTFSLTNFYARRVKRIFPALFVMLVMTSAIAIAMLPPEAFGYHLTSLRMAAGQISNFFFVNELDYFDTSAQSAALLHTWSLGVEEQFYLVWPFLLLVSNRFLPIKKAYILIILIGISSLALSEYLVRTDMMQAFYMLHARAWELAIGGILAFDIVPRAKKFAPYLAVLGCALIGYGMIFLNAAHFPGLNALFPCLGAALIIYSGLDTQSFVHRALSMRWVVFIGLISYSLYLWHWPLIIFYKGYFAQDLSFLAQIGLSTASFVVAILSYYLVECTTRYCRWRPWTIIVVGVLTMVTLIVGSNVLKKHAQSSWRITQSLDADITDPNQWVKTCSDEGGAYDDSCIIGPNKDGYEVILSGDSHASHYIPTVLAWAQENGLTTRIFMRGACRTWQENDGARFKNGKRDTYCEELSDNFFTTLEQDKAIQYVFLAQRFPKGSDNEKRSLMRIKAFGKQTVFLGAVNEFAENPNHCFVRGHLLMTAIFPKNDAETCREFDEAYNAEILEKTQSVFIPMLRDLGVSYFDAALYLDPPYDAAGRFLYMDKNHLNIHGAQHLILPFKEFMKADQDE